VKWSCQQDHWDRIVATTMLSRDTLTRAGLAVLVLAQGSLAVWALAAPRSFFDAYPGGGRAWVSPLGPYDEHLVRDVGSLSLALTVVLVAAAWTLDRRVVMAAAAAYLAWELPHLVFHLGADDVLSAGDRIASWTGQGAALVIAAAVLVAAVRGSKEIPA
jgi:hypothetical protein